MGFPLNSYTVLRAFLPRTGDRHGLDNMYARLRDAVSGFHVIAMVLYDRETNPGFASDISRDFGHLHRDTGDHLLFFAAVDGAEDEYREADPPNWLELARELQSDRSREYRPRTVQAREGTARVLALAMGIPPSSLPCVVFTDDAQRDQWGWCHVEDAMACREALMCLADYSRMVEPNGLADLGVLAARLANAPRHSEVRWWTIRPALVEAQPSSIHQTFRRRGEAHPHRPDTPHGCTDPQRRTAAVVDGVLGCLTSAAFDQAEKGEVRGVPQWMGSSEEPSSDSLFAYGSLRMAQVGVHHRGPDFIRHLEPEASAALRVACLHFPLREDNRLDRGVVAVSLGKVLEIEVNGSLVQEIRRYLGAVMPEDYRKRSRVPGLGKMPVRLGEREIYLNDRRGAERWTAVDLGGLARLLRLPRMLPVIAQNVDLEPLTSAISLVRPHRNVGGHTGAPSARALEAIWASVSRVDEARGFADMARLRRSLQAPG